MISTKRTQILAHIKSILETVQSLRSVDINKTSVIDLETVAFPCAFIFSDRETKVGDDRGVIGYENWEWLLSIEVWSDERSNQEEILGEIHAAMASDYTFGGLVPTSDRTGSSFFVLDPTRSISSMVIDYSVLYRHKKGDPTN